MMRRYELTDDEWNRIAGLLPPENTGKPGRPPKDNRIMLSVKDSKLSQNRYIDTEIRLTL